MASSSVPAAAAESGDGAGTGARPVLALIPALLALGPILALALTPPLSTADVILMVLYGVFALVAISTFSDESSASPRSAQLRQTPLRRGAVQATAVLAWLLFRALVFWDSVPCSWEWFLCRPENDLVAEMFLALGALIALVVSVFLYADMMRDLERAGPTCSSEAQVVVFALSFLWMLLQLLFWPPISAVMYVLNFLFMLYTAYVVVHVTLSFGAANEAGLAVFAGAMVLVMSLLNQYVPDKPGYVLALFGVVSVVSALGSWALGVVGFRDLFEAADPARVLRVDDRALRSARESLFLCVLAAGALFVAQAVLSFTSPPGTVFDFVMTMIVAVGQSALLKVFAWTYFGHAASLLVWLAAALGLGLVLGLVPSSELVWQGQTWCIVEIVVTLVFALGTVLRAFSGANLSARARTWIGIGLALSFLAAVVVIVATSAHPQLNFVFVVCAAIGLTFLLLLVRLASARAEAKLDLVPSSAASAASAASSMSAPSGGAVGAAAPRVLTSAELHEIMRAHLASTAGLGLGVR